MAEQGGRSAHKSARVERDPTRVEREPTWPRGAVPPTGAPNILLVLFDDVGFSDFGCYGSNIATPTIDRLAARGLRYTGFHTTAMCSTTRAALLTGRNHHSVGMGCLANFDSGHPGYRGRISPAAGTLAEMLRPQAYRNYMLGKWHVTPLHESGPTGPLGGWPLGRGFDRFYGFMDAETDQYAPELVRDNTPVAAPGSHAGGYHLSVDLIDESIRYLGDHLADRPDLPFLCWLAFGACHAPHQAPRELILKYDDAFAHGWDVERERRLAWQREHGIVPDDTRMPERNAFVRAWTEHTPDEQRLFRRLQGAHAAMLEHADNELARLLSFLERAGVADNTIVLVLSDNGASQEGGPLGMVNAMGPYNLRPEPLAEKIVRIDDIGGPDTHSNFPLGWAMAANTPLRRYKQNTHGGGIRDPLVISWPARVADHGALRHQFTHACDVVPTLLELIGIDAPQAIAGITQMPLEGESFAASLEDAQAPAKSGAQYFEMFGHRGIVHDGWKAVAYHAPGSDYAQDRWELYELARDVSETNDLAAAQPERLAALIERWWREADAHQVLPLDDRFGPRFAENAARKLGARREFVFHAGMGHLPTDATPDLRGRSYRIEARVRLPEACPGEGVLIAHGDATSGYALYLQDGYLVHDLNVGGVHQLIRSAARIGPGDHLLGFHARFASPRLFGELLVDGVPEGSRELPHRFVLFISWSGLDIGLDRGSPVSAYEAPFAFNGELAFVRITIDLAQAVDAEGAAQLHSARD